MAEDWKISKKAPSCSACGREFGSQETHYSGIHESEDGFARRDYCLECWKAKPEEPFSYWKTQSPPRQEDRRLGNVQAMIEFFVRLTAGPLDEPLRRKVAYLAALLLMRRRRLKLVSSKDGELELEQAWDGETKKIPDPVIAEEELDSLKEEMERLFDETAGAPPGA